MSDYVVLDVETTGNEPWRDALICVGIGRNVHPPHKGRTLARMLMAKPGTTLVAHTNYDLRWLLLDGATLAEGVHYHDTKVMAWLLDSTQELGLDDLAAKYLGYVPPKLIRKQAGRIMFQSKAGLVPIEEAPWDEMVDYNQSDIKTTGELYECLRALLMERDQWEHFLAEEAPFSRLLVEMEADGLPFAAERARALLAEKEATHATLRASLVAATGWSEFNPNSGDQVARYLYEDLWTTETKFDIPRLTGMSAERKLAAVQSIAPPGVRVERVGREYAYGTLALEGRGLAAPKRTKREEARASSNARPSVSAKKLNVLHGGDPWVADYIAYQRAGKLCGYLRDWIAREHDGRLHGRFDQSGTVTGRLAAREPNLQQVSGEVRDLFVGDLVVGDYGGLEARLAAHFSRDPVMLDIFQNGKDLYGVMAARAWGGPEGKDNPGRGLMKLLWLSSQYGAQGETLAETLAVAGMRGYGPRKADALLRDLENTVPRMFEWREEVIAEARALGYVTTLAGRPRQLPDLASAEWKRMARAERQAVSTKVQGSAADVVRRAMLRCRQILNRDEARIALQVHDEILWARGPRWDDEMLPVLVHACEQEHGFDLEVPLVFEAGIATSWAAKGGSNTQAVAEAVAALA